MGSLYILFSCLWLWTLRHLTQWFVASFAFHMGIYCDVTPTGPWNILEASRTVWHVTIPVRTSFVRVSPLFQDGFSTSKWLGFPTRSVQCPASVNWIQAATRDSSPKTLATASTFLCLASWVHAIACLTRLSTIKPSTYN